MINGQSMHELSHLDPINISLSQCGQLSFLDFLNLRNLTVKLGLILGSGSQEGDQTDLQ